jgi:GNAT superfamily N-acetyltransferase
MEIGELDIHDTTLTDELFGLHQAVHAADSPDTPAPLREPFLAELRQTHPDVRDEWLVARAGGRLVGSAELTLPEIDNRHLAQVRVRVSPAHRRRGLGRALLDRLHRRIDEEHRTTVICSATRQIPGGPPRSDAGARFLTSMGYTPALEVVQRRLDLTAVDRAAEQRLLDESLRHAGDYDCVTWTGLTPDPLAGGVAYLVNRLLTDAPTGELALEPTTVDVERLHADDRNAIDRQTHLVGAAARHRATGEVAAVTRIDVRPAGDHGSIWITIADPRHRGHRLGTIVKIEAHRAVRRAFPALRYVYTGNADVNRQMAAINERLGFVAYQAGTGYQLIR